MMRFPLGEDEGSNMRVGKVTLNNSCSSKAGKEACFQVAQQLSPLSSS